MGPVKKSALFVTIFGLLLASCAHQTARGFYAGNLCNSENYYGDLKDEMNMASADKKALGILKLDKVDDLTIKFTGIIEDGDAKALEKILETKPKRIIVKSAGGEIGESLRMAELLRTSSIEELVVDRICLSSCAAYLFVAVPKKWIRDGIVGFHGNATALFNDSDLLESIKSSPANKGANEATIKKWISENKERGVKKEQEFLKAVGVKQTLFDLTQRKDKGQNNGKIYPFFLPGPKKMAEYGIRNVRGEQNRCIGESLGMENLYSD